MRRNWWTLLVILAIAALAGMAAWPQDVGFVKNIRLHPGLDLQGGAQLVYELDTSEIEADAVEDATDGVRNVIENRINALGVAEPVIQASRVGDKDAIIVELPGVQDVEEAKNLIGRTAELTFWRPIREDEESVDNPFLPDFVPSDLTGADLKRAQVVFDQNNGVGVTNQAQVQLEFNNEGKDKFKSLTEEYLGQQLAIVLDEIPVSAPVIQAVIPDGTAVISGNFDLESAKQLSIQLNAGALPVPVQLTEERTIGPSLGEQSVQSSLIAGLLGLILVAAYMIGYYRLAGLLATLALAIYTLISLAIFELIPITLTLAGIAGFILSIGMAVDANILIFERMKEEQRLGKPINIAIDEGFRRAWSSIWDSNVSSLITAAILYYSATGLVRGFAVTLAIGILVSMFTAVTISKTFLKFALKPKRGEL
ncbi:protein translocase subunit SecD [Candidatus Berkelbacteria bacterium]|nr:protein translocase subunit SecD [Candidatus Berkelbacteria bacterium]